MEKEKTKNVLQLISEYKKHMEEDGTEHYISEDFLENGEEFMFELEYIDRFGLILAERFKNDKKTFLISYCNCRGSLESELEIYLKQDNESLYDAFLKAAQKLRESYKNSITIEGYESCGFVITKEDLKYKETMITLANCARAIDIIDYEFSKNNTYCDFKKEREFIVEDLGEQGYLDLFEDLLEKYERSGETHLEPVKLSEIQQTVAEALQEQRDFMLDEGIEEDDPTDFNYGTPLTFNLNLIHEFGIAAASKCGVDKERFIELYNRNVNNKKQGLSVYIKADKETFEEAFNNAIDLMENEENEEVRIEFFTKSQGVIFETDLVQPNIFKKLKNKYKRMDEFVKEVMDGSIVTEAFKDHIEEHCGAGFYDCLINSAKSRKEHLKTQIEIKKWESSGKPPSP